MAKNEPPAPPISAETGKEKTKRKRAPKLPSDETVMTAALNLPLEKRITLFQSLKAVFLEEKDRLNKQISSIPADAIS